MYPRRDVSSHAEAKPLRRKAVAGACLAVILVGIAPVSVARNNWLRLGDNARAEIYVDSTNVERPPLYVKFWSMLNYKQRQRGGWLSEKRLFMYSCKEHALEWQQSMYYATPMADGEFIQARTLNRYGLDDPRLGELDPSTKDKRKYKDAVPEAAFNSVFDRLC